MLKFSFLVTMLLLQTLDDGQPSGHAWVDFDNDGDLDFARVVGTTPPLVVLRVTLSSGREPSKRADGATIQSATMDGGYAEGRAWADFNGDGKADFGRVVGSGTNQLAFVTLSQGNTFASTPIRSPNLYGGVHYGWGYPEGRAWVDFNGDRKADFVRIVGGGTQPLWAAITFSEGTAFGRTVRVLVEPHLDYSRRWADVDGDGKADFIRLKNDNTIAVSYSNGAGFSRTLVEPLRPSR